MSHEDRLVRALQTIGCPSAKELTGEDLQWMFENESCLPFLEWFIDVIEADPTGENIVSDDELTRYDKLVSLGKEIVEDEKLSETSSYLIYGSGKESSHMDSLREEVKDAKQKKQDIDKSLHNLVFQRNTLSLHQAKVSHQLNQMNEITKNEKQNYKRALEKSKAVNAKMDSALSDLQQTVCGLTELYTHSKKVDHSTRKLCLSQLVHNEYFESEEAFTCVLTTYTKKQFFEGIADLAGKNDKSRYDLLEISDPTSLLIKGENEQVTMNECKELSRLKLVFIPSETQRINSQASATGVQAALKFAKEKAMMHHQQVCDVVSLQDRVDETLVAFTGVKEDIAKITEKTSSLIHRLAELQPTQVLKGDYDLKISRQDYFISKQDQVINQLLCQRSRYEFLSMALEVETFKNRETHRLLSVVESNLQQSLTGLNSRLDKMDNPGLQLVNARRGTIDRRDIFLGHVYKMLEPFKHDIPCDDQLFQMYNQVLEWGVNLSDQLQRLASIEGSTEQTQTDVLRTLEHTLQQCQKVCNKSNRPGSFTNVGLQHFHPLAHLQELLSSLEKSLNDVLKNVEAKKKVLRCDSLKAMERDLFLSFFDDTERLKRTLAQLSARVDAQIVSN